jgi:DnaJ-domain-containing protein 1
MDYYELLQVHPKADLEAIQAAYERLRVRYAPDKLAGAADEIVELAQTRLKQIDEAYRTLSDSRLRAAYDAKLAEETDDLDEDDDYDQAEDELDYSALPPAGRQERAKNSHKATSAPIKKTKRGRRQASRSEQELPNWLMPSLIGAGVIALIATITFIAAAQAIPGTDTRTSAGNVAAATAQVPVAATPDQATLLATFNQFEDAITQAQVKANSAVPSADAWIQLGHLLYDSTQVVRELQPDSAIYQERIPRWLAASEAYARALELQPANPSIRSDRGVSLCYYGEDMEDQSYVQQGLAEAEQAANEAPTDPRILYNLGVCQVTIQPAQTEKALESWAKVASMSADAPSLATQAQLLIEEYNK